MQKRTKEKQVFLTVGTLVTWFAVILQFCLIILNRVTSVPETIIRFFSFYTILTNIIVAFFFTVVLLKLTSRWGNYFIKPSIATAIALYITVVGLVYNLILRFLWSPTGLQKLADEILHGVVPLLFIFYWFWFIKKSGLKWKNIVPWLAYPLIYVIFILLRGSISGFYPYPFIDVNTIGYSKVFLNSLGILGLFLLVSMVFILIAKYITKKAENLQL